MKYKLMQAFSSERGQLVLKLSGSAIAFLAALSLAQPADWPTTPMP
jgi:hypothetical protein